MEELWTPWRMRYILGTKDPGACVFCRKESTSEEGELILHRGRRTYTILNLYPYTIGHLMVIPYRHLPRFRALETAEREEMALSLRQAETILRRVAQARWFHMGMNLGRAAGAGVEGHLHAHLVPRGGPPSWNGRLSPSGELPVPIEETFRILRPHFAALSGCC